MRFSSWLDTATPVASAQPSKTPSCQQTKPSNPDQLRSPRGATAGSGHPRHSPAFPGEIRPRRRERRRTQATTAAPSSPVMGKDRSPARGPRTRCDPRAGGWGCHGDCAGPVPDELAMATPAPYPPQRPPPQTPPRSPGRGGGRALSTSREAEPDGEAPGTETGGTSSTGAPRSNAPPHWLAAGHVTSSGAHAHRGAPVP